jgi:chromosome segregation ATPase
MPWWLWWLILGALIARIIEWLIDWRYWRAKLKTTVSEWETTSTAHEQLHSQLEAERKNARHRDAEFGIIKTSLSTAQGELDGVRGELGSAHADNARLRAELTAAQEREVEWSNVRLGRTNDLDGARGELHTAHAEIERLRAAAQNREVEWSNVRLGRTNDLDGARGELHTAHADNARLRADLAAAQDREVEWGNVRLGLTNDLDGLRANLAAAQDREVEWNNVRLGLTNDLDGLRRDLDAAHADNARLRADLAAAQPSVRRSSAATSYGDSLSPIVSAKKWAASSVWKRNASASTSSNCPRARKRASGNGGRLRVMSTRWSEGS